MRGSKLKGTLPPPSPLPDPAAHVENLNPRVENVSWSGYKWGLPGFLDLKIFWSVKLRVLSYGPFQF